MSISNIPDPVRYALWGKSAGRCHYCNKPIYLDDFTKAEFNNAYIAHIIADKPGGPRGHATKSEELKADISNLMLLCDSHHRLIDKGDVEGHPVELLLKMKADHEARVAIQTETQGKQSHIVLYGAKIGLHDAPLTWHKSKDAMSPHRYPVDTNAISIGLQNNAQSDDEKAFWDTERQNLNRVFDRSVRRLITDGTIQHLSIFALAPQPLLIELGRLISDLREADVYQLQREPTTWRWHEHDDEIEFKIIPPTDNKKNVALNISLSATVDNSRIHTVLGDDAAIWTLTVDTPHNDFLKTKKTLSKFRTVARQVFAKIKDTHGQNTLIHVFPVMPVSAAVEFGRTWQPKADAELLIYDQNRNTGGFSPAFTIQNKEI